MKTIIIARSLSAIILFSMLLSGCTLTISIVGNKHSAPPIATQPLKQDTIKPVAKIEKIEKKKSRYQEIKDSLKGDWLNLPLPADHKTLINGN